MLQPNLYTAIWLVREQYQWLFAVCLAGNDKRSDLDWYEGISIKEGLRFHDLRHTNVALRIEQGQNIKYIQNQLGHASIQTTLDRYGHLIKEVNSEQAKKLDTILGFDKISDSEALVRRLLEDNKKKALILSVSA